MHWSDTSRSVTRNETDVDSNEANIWQARKH